MENINNKTLNFFKMVIVCALVSGLILNGVSRQGISLIISLIFFIWCIIIDINIIYKSSKKNKQYPFVITGLYIWITILSILCIINSFFNNTILNGLIIALMIFTLIIVYAISEENKVKTK